MNDSDDTLTCNTIEVVEMRLRSRSEGVDSEMCN